MKAEARERATYDDLLKVPENLVAELIDGALYTWPRPSPQHSDAASAILADVRYRYGRGGDGGGWRILFEPELHLLEEAFVPDLGGWRRERLPVLPSTAWISVVPDWICEVMSPSTGRFDRQTKLPAYARHGVAYAWIVDPERQTLDALRLENGRWTLLGVYGGKERVAIEPFPEVELNLAELWNLPAGQ